MFARFLTVSAMLSRSAPFAALALGVFSLPASAVTVCTAQGNCASFDGTCEMDGNYACASGDTGTHCYYGGSCFPYAAPQGVSSIVRDFSQLDALERGVDRARVGAVRQGAAMSSLPLRQSADR